MQGELPDPRQAEGLVWAAVGALAHPAPVLGSVPQSCLPHGAGPQPVGGSGSHAGRTGRWCWRLSEDWAGVMRVSAGHTPPCPPPPPYSAPPHCTEGKWRHAYLVSEARGEGLGRELLEEDGARSHCSSCSISSSSVRPPAGGARSWVRGGKTRITRQGTRVLCED